MAEAIGVASAITTLVTLALQSTITLYQTVKSFNTREKTIRELRDELQDLLGVLQTLNESMCNVNLAVAALEQPLKRCCNACMEFNALLKKCLQHSTDTRSSKRDWLKLQYMGEDIAGFKSMLAGYKSTIIIALAYANLRTTKAANNVLNEYKELIENTKYDLETHLQDIRTRLQSLVTQDRTTTELDTAELRRMEEEKDSTQKSLDICEQFLTHIDQTRSTLIGDIASTSSVFKQSPSFVEPSVPWLIAAEALNSAHKEFTSSKLRLMQHFYGLDKQLQTTAQYCLPLPHAEQTSDQQSFQEEAHGIEASLAFFNRVAKEANQPRMNIFEDISTGDNSRQVVVTTLRDLISAKRIKSGDGSSQFLGQMSNDSLQKISLWPNPSGANGSK